MAGGAGLAPKLGAPASTSASLDAPRTTNPFNHLPTTDLSCFVGRSAETQTALEVFAARKNLIVSGAPGIGKSSFLNQVSAVLARRNAAVAMNSWPWAWIAVARHQCEQGSNLDDIRAGLISGLRRDYAETGSAAFSPQKAYLPGSTAGRMVSGRDIHSGIRSSLSASSWRARWASVSKPDRRVDPCGRRTLSPKPVEVPLTCIGRLLVLSSWMGHG
jgi:hypothetical protein